jgi:hypothetical protein
MTPAGTTQYVYDLAGHLIAEADGSGNTLTEYVWLDDMPLAVVANVDTSPTLYFVHPDHLNRPIKMTDGSESVVWDAVYNPFGASIPSPARHLTICASRDSISSSHPASITGEFSPEYPETEWGHLKTGVFVCTDKGALVRLEGPLPPNLLRREDSK